MKKKVTIRQAIDFCKAFDNLKDSGIVFKGLSLIDLADNNVVLRPLVTAWEKAIEDAKLAASTPTIGNNFQIDSTKFAPAVAELKKKYAAAIFSFTKLQELQVEILDKEREVDIIEIPRDQISIDEKNNNAAQVLFGLIIVLSKRI
jgi:chorismate mutase